MVNSAVCQMHADLLSKYSDMFPVTFIDSIRHGVSWLCNHNGITYQTSTMIKTDVTVYAASNPGILRIGLIDLDRPLSGLTYFNVRKVEEIVDSVSGNTTFKVELEYKTPVGIVVTLIPILYFEPKLKLEEKFYTKLQIDEILKTLKEEIDSSIVVKENTTDVDNKLAALSLGVRSDFIRKYDTAITFDIGNYAFTIVNDKLKFYQSLTGDNKGNAVSDTSKWREIPIV